MDDFISELQIFTPVTNVKNKPVFNSRDYSVKTGTAKTVASFKICKLSLILFSEVRTHTRNTTLTTFDRRRTINETFRC